MYSGANKGILQYYYSNFKSIHSVNAVVLQKSIIDITLKKTQIMQTQPCVFIIMQKAKRKYNEANAH